MALAVVGKDGNQEVAKSDSELATELRAQLESVCTTLNALDGRGIQIEFDIRKESQSGKFAVVRCDLLKRL